MWIKNTNGKKDAMLTFAAFSFLVVTLNILLATFESITIGETTLILKSLDSSVMAVYLGSTFTAYVSRRWTDSKYKQNSEPNPVVETVLNTIESFSDSQQAIPEVALSQIEQDPTDEISHTKKRKTKKDSV